MIEHAVRYRIKDQVAAARHGDYGTSILTGTKHLADLIQVLGTNGRMQIFDELLGIDRRGAVFTLGIPGNDDFLFAIGKNQFRRAILQNPFMVDQAVTGQGNTCIGRSGHSES